MKIIATIDRCLHMIPAELIKDHTIYAEVDKENYDELEKEIEALTNDSTVAFTQTKIPDMGNCKVLQYQGFKIIISLYGKVMRSDNFYIAFKTNII